MAVYTFSQLPQIENLYFVSGDIFQMTVRLNMDVTSTPLAANVKDASGNLYPLTVIKNNSLIGDITILMDSLETAALQGQYAWALTTGTKTLINGEVFVSSPYQPLQAPGTSTNSGAVIEYNQGPQGIPGINPLYNRTAFLQLDAVIDPNATSDIILGELTVPATLSTGTVMSRQIRTVTVKNMTSPTDLGILNTAIGFISNSANVGSSIFLVQPLATQEGNTSLVQSIPDGYTLQVVQKPVTLVAGDTVESCSVKILVELIYFEV